MKRKVLLVFIVVLMIPMIVSAQTKEWSLEECIRYALQNNIQLKQKEISTQYQASTLELSKLAILPSLNASASHQYSYGRTLDQSSYEYTDNNTGYYSYGASSGVTLFSGLKNFNTIKKNKYTLLSGEQDLIALKDDISLNIALAYLQILLDKELVTSTSAQVELTNQQIERTKKLVDAGSVARGNLLDIEAQAASEELLLTNQQNALSISYLNLAQMLDIENDETFGIVIPELTINPVDIEGNATSVYSVAEKIRPEILSAEYSLKASESDLAIAKGGRSPILDFRTSLGTWYAFNLNTELVPRPDFKDALKNNLSYGIGLSLSIPIFNGWQVNKGISNARLAIHYSEYTLEATRKQLLKNISQSYADAEGALRKYYSSKKAVEAMEEAFRYSEQKFNVGLVNAVDYNQAKTKLLNAQSEMSQAKYEYLFKTKVLDFYKGLPISLEQTGVISK